MKRMAMLMFCCGLASGVLAQYDLGIWNSNYAGIQGSLLNPSSIAGSRLDWDVHLFSVNVDFANDFLYAPKNSVPFFCSGGSSKAVSMRTFSRHGMTRRIQTSFIM
jgi:hypothetical protein